MRCVFECSENLEARRRAELLRRAIGQHLAESLRRRLADPSEIHFPSLPSDPCRSAEKAECPRASAKPPPDASVVALKRRASERRLPPPRHRGLRAREAPPLRPRRLR